MGLTVQGFRVEGFRVWGFRVLGLGDHHGLEFRVYEGLLRV